MIRKMLIVPISAVVVMGCVSPLKDPDPIVRRDAVSKLANQEELIRFVREDEDLSVRETALRRVESQEALKALIYDVRRVPVGLKIIAAEKLTDEALVNQLVLSGGIDSEVRLVLVGKVKDERVLLKAVADRGAESEVRDAAANHLTQQQYIDEAVKSFQNDYLIRKTTDMEQIGKYLAKRDVVDRELLEKIKDPGAIRKLMKLNLDCKRLVAKISDDQEILWELLGETYKMGGAEGQKLCDELIAKISDEDILLRAFLASDSRLSDEKILEKKLSDKCRLSMLIRLDEKKRNAFGDWNRKKSELVNLIVPKITDQDSLVDAILGQYVFKVVDNNVTYTIDSSISSLSDRLDEEHKKRLDEKRLEKISSVWAEIERPILEKANGGDLSSVILLAEIAAKRHDYIEALRWREKAADKGHFDSMWRCGNYYFNGWGVNKDLDKALDYYERSAKFQYEPAIASVNEVHYVKSHPDVRSGDEIDQFTIPRLKPEEKGFYYTYAGGEGFERLRVIQSLPAKGIVLVKPAVDFGAEDTTEKKGILCILTNKEYVKDEYLRSGIFEYNGLYTYQTAIGMRTVRSFKEWVAK